MSSVINFAPKPYHRTDMSGIPVAEVIEQLNYEQILSELKASFLSLVPEDELPHWQAALQLESEPVVLQLEACAYRELLYRNKQNLAFGSLLLSEAAGSNLDALAANPPWGIERLAGENDERFKRRILLAIASASSAGSREDYLFYTLSADLRVHDAEVLMHEVGTGQVDLYLLEDGQAASAEVISIVESVVTADHVRPLTDHVVVQSAEIIDYQVDAKLWLYEGPDAGIVEQYATTQLNAFTGSIFRFGFNIHKTALIAAAHVAGVQRVELNMSIDEIIVDRHQAARCTAINVEVLGYDE